jgi:ABC-type nitrate/sulfonate/bicarbonate transport system ATPase subunit
MEGSKAMAHSDQDIMVAVNDVSKSFVKPGKRRNPEILPVLRNINIQIKRSEFVAIVGPTGCGKTSVLRAIGGLLPIDAGAITVDGKLVTGPGLDRAMVFQDATLLPWATALENAAFGLKQRGVPKKQREELARESLETVGLGHRAAALPHEMSGGMRQRVGIARALAVNPGVLLMDEPFGALDSLTREQANIDVTEICAEEGATTLLITHSIEEAAFMSDEVLVMSPRPSRIVGRIPIHLPRPRTLALKGTPEFARCVQEIRDVFSREGVLNDHR